MIRSGDYTLFFTESGGGVGSFGGFGGFGGIDDEVPLEELTI